MKLSYVSGVLIALWSSNVLSQPAASPPPAPGAPATQTPLTPPVETPVVSPVGAVEPSPVVGPEPPKETAIDASKPALPKKLAVGKDGNGLFQPGVLLQGWFWLQSSGGDTQLSTFRLRRAELSVKGEIVPKRIAYKMMFDPARVLELGTATVTDGTGMKISVPAAVSPTAAMQDFEITHLSDWGDITIGQFKIPVSWEGLNSSAKIVFPERDFVSQKFGDKRDLGIKVTKAFKLWSYFVGIYNGQGSNTRDANNQKDVAIRLEAYPVKGLTLAATAYDSIGYRSRAGTKDRWEADVRYEGAGVLVQGEFIRARDVGATGAVTGQGGYVLAGYSLKDPSFKGEIQPVVRVGMYDPNVHASNDAQKHYDLGVNYYLQGHEMKVQGSYAYTQFDESMKKAGHELILAAQVWY